MQNFSFKTVGPKSLSKSPIPIFISIISQFVENVETWIQFANTYNSVIFTSLISSFAERRAKNNTLPANWHTIIENNQNFAQLVGKVRLGLSIPPPAKYVVKKSESIYLVCDDI